VLLTFNHSVAHTIQLRIYMAHFPLLFSSLAGFPLLPLCVPLVFPSTYLAPSSCDRNRPPPSQVACKLTLFGPPVPPLGPPPPRCPDPPPAPRRTMTTSGIFRLLLSGTIYIYIYIYIFIYGKRKRKTEVCFFGRQTLDGKRRLLF
jgi:hypothetical protein